MNITKKDLSFITITEILLIIKTNLGVYRFMPIWHQSPKLTPRYFLETPRLFGYPTYSSSTRFNNSSTRFKSSLFS